VLHASQTCQTSFLRVSGSLSACLAEAGCLRGGCRGEVLGEGGASTTAFIAAKTVTEQILGHLGAPLYEGTARRCCEAAAAQGCISVKTMCPSSGTRCADGRVRAPTGLLPQAKNRMMI
jgi:hypothetical protein